MEIEFKTSKPETTKLHQSKLRPDSYNSEKYQKIHQSRAEKCQAVAF